jgi:hypothetical protein
VNRTYNAETLRGKRILKASEAMLADLLLEEMGLVERIEQDLLPEQGIATSAEIYEGLGL